MTQSAVRICAQDTLKVTYTLDEPGADIMLVFDDMKTFRRVAGPFQTRST